MNKCETSIAVGRKEEESLRYIEREVEYNTRL
jgi:hypothetical protein